MTITTTTPDAEPQGGANQLLDFVLAKLQLKNDAALCRVLDVAPPVVSKMRHERIPVTARMMIKIHEVSGLSIREIKTFLGMRTP